jgi:DNA-binding response OmpR family regulator
MSKLLVVEDERALAEGLRFNLEAEGYTVEVVDSGEAALDLLLTKRSQFDVVVLDVMLPGKDGFTVLRELRAAGLFVPVLILTARGHADDVLNGFAAGCDDYLPKPFELAILIARIGSLLRRREWLRKPPTIVFGNKSVDLDRQELRVGTECYPLTLMEANVLRYLMQSDGAPVSRKVLLEEVWGLHEDTDTRAIDNFIVRLRKYIEDDPAKPRHLLTVRGVGYRFVKEP